MSEGKEAAGGAGKRGAGSAHAGPFTLGIDIGGSGLKASVLDVGGDMVVERVRVETPKRPAPERVVEALVTLVEGLPAFDRVSVGFPGVVKEGVVHTAPNLGTDAWRGFDLARALERRLKRPARVANDADLQGLGVVRGRGIEMVVTLGTGFGTALFANGRLAPHLEISHHVFRKKETYDQAIGNRARQKLGNGRWSRRVLQALDAMRALTSFDHLYVGGGNARRLTVELPADVSIADNLAGITGGVALWRDEIGAARATRNDRARPAAASEKP